MLLTPAPLSKINFVVGCFLLLVIKLAFLTWYWDVWSAAYLFKPMWVVLTDHNAKDWIKLPVKTDHSLWQNVTALLTVMLVTGGNLLLGYRRLKALGLSPVLLTLYSIPFLNLILFFVLVDNAPTDGSGLKAFSRKDLLWTLVFQAVAILFTVLFITKGIEKYTAGLFIGLPFLSGYLCYQAFKHLKLNVFLISLMATLSGCLAIFGSAIEGAICIIMLMPIYFVACLIGATIARYTTRNSSQPNVAKVATTSVLFALLVVIPDMATQMLNKEPGRAVVESSVYIDAPREIVWQALCNFKTIQEEPGWLFKAGIAYPISAKMSTDSLGRKVRYCSFTTGPFVEPITQEIKDSTLSFYVESQPLIMKELSPYQISPAHLEDYIRSERGQFLLIKSGKGTILKGTTWYSSKIEPFFYWKLWCDYVIHDIHLLVLRQIERQSLEELKRGSTPGGI